MAAAFEGSGHELRAAAAVNEGAPGFTLRAERCRSLFFGLCTDHPDGGKTYASRVEELARTKSPRFQVLVDDIQQYLGLEVARALLDRPGEVLPAFEAGLLDALQAVDVDYVKGLTRKPKIGVVGTFGSHHVTARGVTARFVGKMLCVDGVLTRCTKPETRVLTSVYSDRSNPGEVVVRRHPDVFSLERVRASPMVTAPEGMSLEFSMSEYCDQQWLVLQEATDRTPSGQLPRSIEVLLRDDLVSTVKAGQVVRIAGVLKAVPFFREGRTDGVFRTVLLANSVQAIEENVRSQPVAPSMEKAIRQLAARPDCYLLLARSVAPSIWGHEWVKRGMLLQLLGGKAIDIPNGPHLRGDVNILLIGDPSCGKSQMLRFVLNMNPGTVSTTGRGSSGVGLTAAVITAPNGERSLEAGAMVLADGGIICIDEFDKMSDVDRAAIHEAMEQQTVTIAKGGIHTTLNARCSVLAAANPVYGSFDESQGLDRNIRMPDSILSRFDLTYVVRDNKTPEEDMLIADQVLSQRQMRMVQQGETGGGGAIPSDVVQPHESRMRRESSDADDEDDDEVHRTLQLLHEAPVESTFASKHKVSMRFLRSFVQFARQQPAPRLSTTVHERISNFYSELRLRAADRGAAAMVVTPRTLEAIIRLSTAHAKTRFATEVTLEDCYAAEELLLQARGEAELGSAETEADGQWLVDRKYDCKLLADEILGLEMMHEDELVQEFNSKDPLAASRPGGEWGPQDVADLIADEYCIRQGQLIGRTDERIGS